MIWKGIFAVLLMVMAYIDKKMRRIPDMLPVAIALLGILQAAAGSVMPVQERMIGAVLGFGIFAVIMWIRPGAFGGGDIKLMSAGGFVLGWRLALVAFAISVLSGGAYCLGSFICREGRKRNIGKEEISFGPFLCVGMIMSAYLGESIWRWYVS